MDDIYSTEEVARYTAITEVDNVRRASVSDNEYVACGLASIRCHWSQHDCECYCDIPLHGK